jgi:hypothetical protein
MPDAKWSFCDEVQCKVIDEYVENLNAEVPREHSRTTELNNLRQYTHYNKDFGVEEYVNIIQYTHRSVIAKFWCGVAPIRIETWRYEGYQEKTAHVFNCTDLVEDEMHVLLVCPLYGVIRHSMILEAKLVIDDCIGLTLEQHFDVLHNNLLPPKRAVIF